VKKVLSKKKQVLVSAIIGIAFIIFFTTVVTELQSSNKKPAYNAIEENGSSSNKLRNIAITQFTTPYIKEYSLAENTWPNAILADKNGTVWTIGSRSHTLIKLDPRQGITSSYLITGDSTEDELSKSSLMAWTMIQDNGSKIWFSRLGENKMWSFNPSTTKFTSLQSNSSAFQMKIGQESANIWFVTLTGDVLGVIQKIGTDIDSHYVIMEFSVGNGTTPTGLFVKKDHVWVTQLSSGKLLQFVVARNEKGLVSDVSKVSEVHNLFEPTDVLVSGNDTIWITEHGTSTITRYLPDSEPIRFVTSSNEYQTTTLPLWLRESPDGKGIWFNEHGGNRVSFFDTAHMKLTEYEIPTRPTDGYVVYPLNISVDPTDGNKLWFSEWNTDKVGVLDRSVPDPFDISSDSKVTVTESSFNSQYKINIQISKTGNPNLSFYDNSTIYLKKSGPVDVGGRLANMTLELVQNEINLSAIKDNKIVSLLVGNYSHMLPGNYYLTISAGNGIITKSIFIDLNIRNTGK